MDIIIALTIALIIVAYFSIPTLLIIKIASTKRIKGIIKFVLLLLIIALFVVITLEILGVINRIIYAQFHLNFP